MQPLENPRTLFCFPWIFCVPLPGIALYILTGFSMWVLAQVLLVAFLIVGLPLCCCRVYLWFWGCWPFFWPTDVYEKILYLAHFNSVRSHVPPNAGPEFMPVSGLKPRGELAKGLLDYALFLRVPFATAEEFGNVDEPTFIEKAISSLPEREHFETFGRDENPVEFVMKQMSSIYPDIYQDPDVLKVVRTNPLSILPVNDGFERYGGDAYFDQSWNPVMIVDSGMGPLRDDGTQKTVTTKPGDSGWERAKFRFRSSLFTLVTLVDHLYDIHLQRANLFVTALREQMSRDHPIRRFMAPFTYNTIFVNDNAFHNLIREGGLGPRCFALTEQGFALAFAAAPSLVIGAGAGEGGKTILFRPEYVEYLKKKGIDTVYWRQSLQLYDIFLRFVVGYLECYYPKKEDLANDPEMKAAARQYFHQLEYVSPSMLGRFYAKWLAQIMLDVTAGHEQAGAVEVYAQDASWCAFRWGIGQSCGTKQTATATALLMSFTNKKMPKLLDDWTHLFPPPISGDPKAVFQKFQDELVAMASSCDAYNAASSTRPYPECFPMYVNNPKLLEVSVSL
ncbi:unnamed protein product [Durusdinium trenchii]|uniref:Lipoxygenase domain-containing protein n=1 Tax=Durusdinium trenchii TaxID=1381693 RepID=A0ABP0RVX6_9DINO